MIQFQLGNDEYVDILWGRAVLEVQCNCFFDVRVEFVDGFTLGKDVLAYAARAPEFAIVVNFDLHKHWKKLLNKCYRFPNGFARSQLRRVYFAAGLALHAATI